MIVVSDTTAITTLLKAGEISFLKLLFGDVLIPQAVQDELLAYHKELPEFISLRRLTGAAEVVPLLQSLGRGETEAIQLAREIKADLLLIDDRKARYAASALGIHCASLVALVVQGRQNGKIASARDFLENLEKRGGLYLSDSLKADALKIVGEF
jgi:predicted nucleic acid-binding protein